MKNSRKNENVTRLRLRDEVIDAKMRCRVGLMNKFWTLIQYILIIFCDFELISIKI